MEKEAKNALPEIKKKISSYIKLEEGKITKQSLLTVGAFLTGAAAASAATITRAPAENCVCNQNYPTHKNAMQIEYNSKLETAVGKHAHHGSVCNRHCSY